MSELVGHQEPTQEVRAGRYWLLAAGGAVAWIGGCWVAMDQAPQNNDDTNYYKFAVSAAISTLGAATVVLAPAGYAIEAERKERKNNEAFATYTPADNHTSGV